MSLYFCPVRGQSVLIPATLLFTLCFLTAATPAVAAEAELEPVIVTASRLPQNSRDVVGDVTVINRRQLEKYTGESVIAALRDVPNLQVANSGGAGKQTSLYLRGTNTNQVAVFIDGIRYESATTGAAALEQIPADQLERVEVLQGAAAGIYGADAIGGVIQVFTRHGQQQEVHLSAGGGNYKTSQLAAGFSTGLKPNALGAGQFSAGYSYYNTGGFNATNAQFYDYSPENSDRDGYRSNSLSLNGLQTIGEKTRVGLGGLLVRNRTEYDPLTSSSNGYNGAGQIHVSHQFTPKVEAQLKYGLSVDKIEAENVSSYGSMETDYKTLQHQFSALANYRNRATFATLGFDQLRQGVNSSVEYTETSRILNSVSLGGGSRWHRLGWQANLRHDHSGQFGGKTTYRLGGNYDLTPSLQAGASYATAYRIPTFNDLYYPSSFYYTANPGLQPETARNAELNLRYSRPSWQLKGVVYQNRISDLIQYEYDPQSYVGTMTNVGKARMTGASLLLDGSRATGEIPLLSALTGHTLIYGAHADYLNARDVTGEEDVLLPRRAKYAGTGYAGLQHRQWIARAEIQATGKRYDDAANMVPLAGFAIANLYARYRISPALALGLRINNLFDTNYTEVYGYNTAGTNGLLSLEYTWR